MPLTLSPKAQFLSHKKEAEEFSTLMQTSLPINMALTHAMSEMAMKGASTEEMKGARDFITTFINMGEKPEQSAKMTPKHLNEELIPPQEKPKTP